MAYVTNDKRVQLIIRTVRPGGVSRQKATTMIKDLGFLEWEVAEALKGAQG